MLLAISHEIDIMSVIQTIISYLLTQEIYFVKYFPKLLLPIVKN